MYPMFENAKKGELTTTEAAIRLMISENPAAKYTAKLFNEYALNAVDVEMYAPSEIKKMIKKLSIEAGVKQ